MIYHKTQDRSNQHLRPNNGFKVFLRGLFILGLIIILTYYGKVKSPQTEALRTHPLLGWNLKKESGISSLLIFPNDNIDTNFNHTGHRIWIHPPKNPLQLQKEGLRFKSKSLTIIADSLLSTTLAELASTVDSGGKIWILGKQQRSTKTFEEENPHLHFYNDTLPETSYSIDVGEEGEVTVRRTPGEKTFFLDIHLRDYRFFYTNATPQESPTKEAKYSLGVFLTPFKTLPDFIYNDENYQSLVFSGDSAQFQENPTRIHLAKKNQGALFYEEKDPKKLVLNKVEFLHWDGSRQ